MSSKLKLSKVHNFFFFFKCILGSFYPLFVMMDSGDKRGKLGERPRAKCTVNGLEADQT